MSGDGLWESAGMIWTLTTQDGNDGPAKTTVYATREDAVYARQLLIDGGRVQGQKVWRRKTQEPVHTTHPSSHRLGREHGGMRYCLERGCNHGELA